MCICCQQQLYSHLNKLFSLRSNTRRGLKGETKKKYWIRTELSGTYSKWLGEYWRRLKVRGVPRIYWIKIDSRPTCISIGRGLSPNERSAAMGMWHHNPGSWAITSATSERTWWSAIVTVLHGRSLNLMQSSLGSAWLGSLNICWVPIVFLI